MCGEAQRWYGAVHKDCLAEIAELKALLARVNAVNDNPAHFCKEIDDLTVRFSSEHQNGEARQP